MRNFRGLLSMAIAVLGCVPVANAMELIWTRPAGQWPSECTPLVADLDGHPGEEILAINKIGQLMLWRTDGTALGEGQDGTIAQLPEGPWTSSPVLMETGGAARVLLCSEAGLVLALDAGFKEVWRATLPGKTRFARGVATPLVTAGGILYCFADLSGALSAFQAGGALAWRVQLDGPCSTFLQTGALEGEEAHLLAAAGGKLHRIGPGGAILWTCELGGTVLSRPEIYPDAAHPLIVCGASDNQLAAVSFDGTILWQTPAAEMDASITFLPRKEGAPLVLCTGLWGDLHAFDADGRAVWTHRFRSKNRARPLVIDADGDGASEVFVVTYGQRGYLIDASGRRLDEVHFTGLVNASPIVINEGGNQDILVMTNVLMAQRFRLAPPKPVYGASDAQPEIGLQFTFTRPREAAAVTVSNPLGALVRVQVRVSADDAPHILHGVVTARTAFELPVGLTASGAYTIAAEATDATGKIAAAESWWLSGGELAAAAPPSNTLYAWSTPAYGDFDDTRLNPAVDEGSMTAPEITVPPLYAGEHGAGAFVAVSTLERPVRARVTVSTPTLEDGTAFSGTVALHEVVMTGTVNGERAADALPALGAGGLLVVPPSHAAKIWVGVDTRSALPGNYTGSITVQPLLEETAPLTLPLHIDVTDLAMPDAYPLTLCTWDYVPNNWYPRETAAVLDDMGAHGVNVFPRTLLPKAQANADGALIMDWAAFDASLDHLAGRGMILFQVGHPAIGNTESWDAAKLRDVELAWFRAFRDHLKARGLGYEAYAFYPVDEPGLDYGPRVPVYLDAAKLFREADPKFPIYTDPVPGLSMADYMSIAPYVDVWCPNMRLVTAQVSRDPRIADILGSGKTLWSYECVSQVKSLSPLAYNRANAWRAMYFGLDGIGFWTHSTTQDDHWVPGKTDGSEYALVYPGSTPVGSVRWEAVRDGLEDAAAIAMLRESIVHVRNAGGSDALLAEAEAALQRALVDIMELSDAAFIESRDFLQQGDRRIWHTWTDVKRYEGIREEIARYTLALHRALDVAT
ncbi:MAG: PQQ-binding-like beta-propeller repeat protein [Candidatus Hydrogenedentes bacterium]|nr:PQQ-binding-like beta-propeller repeat protein [Candidatus Hydrogenedentota bacterium]